MDKYSIAVLTSINFVDFGDVEPFKGPIKHAMQWVEQRNVQTTQKIIGGIPTIPIIRYSFVEHEVSLEDSWVQLMTEPVEFSMLNLDLSQPTKGDWPATNPNALLEYNFDLSQRIQVESRTVMSFPQIFGDLGGLYEFLATITIFLIGRYQSKVFSLHRISNSFKIATANKGPHKKLQELQKIKELPSMELRSQLFKAIKLSCAKELMFIYWPVFCCFAGSLDQRLKKLIKQGEEQIDRQQCVHRLNLSQNKFKSLLRFKHTRLVKKLLMAQRRQNVLELKKTKKGDKSSSSDDDEGLDGKFDPETISLLDSWE